MSSQDPTPPPPLPQLPGPKLEPCTPNAHADIKLIHALGIPEDLDSQVWKVEINGTVYALKMVSPELLRGNGQD
jgi:hypothetical protein